jgi:hypothetical protein
MNTGHVFRAVLALSLVLASCDSTTSPSRPLNRAELAQGLFLAVSISGPNAGTIHIVIGVENRVGTDMALNFTNGQFFDIEVLDGGGNTAWIWSHNKYFTESLWNLELSPGESYEQDTDWDLTGNDGKPVSPGSYRCRVWITSSPRDAALVYETSLTI